MTEKVPFSAEVPDQGDPVFDSLAKLASQVCREKKLRSIALLFCKTIPDQPLFEMMVVGGNGPPDLTNPLVLERLLVSASQLVNSLLDQYQTVLTDRRNRLLAEAYDVEQLESGRGRVLPVTETQGDVPGRPHGPTPDPQGQTG